MKKQILLSCALAWAVMAGAETIDITTFRYAGPYVVQAPFQVDSVDVNSKTFVSGRLLDTHLSVDVLQQGTLFTGGVLPGSDSGYALHMMGFVLENTRYATLIQASKSSIVSNISLAEHLAIAKELPLGTL